MKKIILLFSTVMCISNTLLPMNSETQNLRRRNPLSPQQESEMRKYIRKTPGAFRIATKTFLGENGGVRTISLCRFCRKEVPTSFRDHLYIHFDIRPFKCNQCDKKYCQNTQLKKHLYRNHQEESSESSSESSTGSSSSREATPEPPGAAPMAAISPERMNAAGVLLKLGSH